MGGVCVRRVRRAFASFFDAHEIRAKREASPNVEVDFALIHNNINSLKRSKFVLYCYDNKTKQTCFVSLRYCFVWRDGEISKIQSNHVLHSNGSRLHNSINRRDDIVKYSKRIKAIRCNIVNQLFWWEPLSHRLASCWGPLVRNRGNFCNKYYPWRVREHTRLENSSWQHGG